MPLPILIFLGLDSPLANGTNRLAVFIIYTIPAMVVFVATGNIDWTLGLVPAAQQMGIYIKKALKSGISAKDVRMMVVDNPAKILGT